MITINIDPIIFQLDHFTLRWYSLIVLGAVSLGIWLGVREAARKGFHKEEMYDIAILVVLAGLAGARIFHVLDHWDHGYAANPIRVLYLWEGGLAIWGGVLGGVLAMAVTARRRAWSLARLLDAAAPGLILAQAFGRLACIITGDAMGKPTQGPFGFAYSRPGAMVPELGVYYTPMPVYEILANLGIFALIWQLRKKDWPDGMLFLVYLILYSTARFLIAYTSSYRIIAFGLTQSQLVALAAMTTALPLIAVSMRKRSSQVSAR